MQQFIVRLEEEGYLVDFEGVTVMSGLTRVEAREAAKLLQERLHLTEGRTLTRH